MLYAVYVKCWTLNTNRNAHIIHHTLWLWEWSVHKKPFQTESKICLSQNNRRKTKEQRNEYMRKCTQNTKFKWWCSNVYWNRKIAQQHEDNKKLLKRNEKQHIHSTHKHIYLSWINTVRLADAHQHVWMKRKIKWANERHE